MGLRLAGPGELEKGLWLYYGELEMKVMEGAGLLVIRSGCGCVAEVGYRIRPLAERVRALRCQSIRQVSCLCGDSCHQEG